MSTETEDVLQTFLEAFGKPEDVRAEIEAYWQQPNASPFPIAIYNHLVDARTIKWGEASTTPKYISPEGAKYLKHYFAETFMQESVTGYIPKHREPLIKAFAGLYAQKHPQRAVYRIDADIMNLSGLNKAMKQASGNEDIHSANAVIRVMANILRNHLKPLGDGDIAPIRHGGDELSIYVRSGADEATVKAAIVAAQTEMVAFIKKAGLRDVPHTKLGKNPGVGIGCGVTRLLDDAGKLKSDVALSVDLEAQIHESKDAFQVNLGHALSDRVSGAASVGHGDGVFRNQAPVFRKVNLAKVESAFNDKRYSEYLSQLKPPQITPPRGLDKHDLIPEEARLDRLGRAIHYTDDDEFADELANLMQGTAAITRKVDFVTNLPEFASIKRRIVPDFCARFGNAARIVHLDFNNMGGGNKLGSWVGDAMARVFTECVKVGMTEQKLKQFIPYLTSQGGGKFTLLLPAKARTDFAVEKLTAAIEKQLIARSKEELGLTKEQADATQPLLDELNTLNDQAVKNRAMGYQDGDPRRPIQPDAKKLTIGDISNTKSRRQGSHLVTLSPVIDLSKDSVIEVVGKLEEMAREGQSAIEGVDHRRAGIERERKGEGRYKRLTNETPLFTHRVDRKIEKESFAETIKLSPPNTSPTR